MKKASFDKTARIKKHAVTQNALKLLKTLHSIKHEKDPPTGPR